MPVLQVVVLVPAVTVPLRGGDLHEPDAPLHQPPCQQAALPERFRPAPRVIEAVHLLRRLGLLTQIGQFGSRRLHAKRKLVIGDRRLQGILLPRPLQQRPVETLNQLKLATLGRIGRIGTLDIGDRSPLAAKQRPLIRRGEEAIREAVESPRRDQPRVDDHETRQVLVLSPEPIRDPGPHTGTPLQPCPVCRK